MTVYMTYWSCETRLPAEALSAARARGFVSDQLVEHDLLYLLEPVRLIASELATNAILHARTDFTVTLTGLHTKVILGVEDAVETHVPWADVPAATEATAMAQNGRGLGIVSEVSQDWGVTTDHPGFKTVWASFPRQAA
jgi:anti-sigma regulatory factor (Ser/Thr protein kinase)